MVSKKFMFVTKPITWVNLRKNSGGVWPVNGRYSKTLSTLKVGDEIIVYITQKSAIAGIVEVTQTLRANNKPLIFSGDVYDYSLLVDFKIVLDEDKMIPLKSILNEIEITKGKENWGAGFQRAILKIIDSDFDLLRSKVYKNYENQTEGD
ncbi:EVE domain-containing protein [Brevibacillus ruminantium]|uniref:EVE domain-containing protein n=1 Tax=Brevibacillus ruminantium TaxID=2950604 RepID=A0ABY4WJE9_9BACL|nr:EVE domain-containing protein [Brevibacillus ruminantium]USG64781.1 EVE domain-containing protein [Brevibacillus ruminantium]